MAMILQSKTFEREIVMEEFIIEIEQEMINNRQNGTVYKLSWKVC